MSARVKVSSRLMAPCDAESLVLQHEDLARAYYADRDPGWVYEVRAEGLRVLVAFRDWPRPVRPERNAGWVVIGEDGNVIETGTWDHYAPADPLHASLIAGHAVREALAMQEAREAAAESVRLDEEVA